MDPTTGIAVVFGAQETPSTELELRKVDVKLESTLYQGLKVV